jgi:alpha-tubulin suppressor-like RCC1 family protein
MNLRPDFSGHSKNSLFIAADGMFKVWGSQAGGEIETDKPCQLDLPVAPNGEQYVISQLAVGLSHNIILTTTSDVLVWGCDNRGQLGTGKKDTRYSPTLLDLPPGIQFSRVACGSFFSMGITEEGDVYSWGGNPEGQLGLGHREERVIPTKIEGIPDKIVEVACGYSHSLALTAEGEVYAWGRNEAGELGIGNFSSGILEPTKIPSLQGVARIFANFHSMALTQSRKLYVWGWNSYRSLGLGDADNRNTPVLLREGVISVACGGGHSFALLENGDIIGWGCNNEGQLALGDDDIRPSPVSLPLLAKLRAENQRPATIGCCYDHSFLVTNTGELYIWGLGHQGQLGNGNSFSSNTPIKVDLKVMVTKEDAEEKWAQIFMWLFLGRLDEQSAFSRFPIEVIFYSVTCILNK